MKNKTIKLWISLTALFSCISVNAYDFESDGLCYNILSETDRTVETTYYSNNSSLQGNYVSGEITIPEKLIYNDKTYTVIAIGDNTFHDCSNLTSISIPNSVTSIGVKAFIYCSGMTSVFIPTPVNSIGDLAFHGCNKLTEITVDINNPEYCSINGILYTKDRTILIKFPAGYNTSFFEIPNSVTAIGYCAFSGCRGLTSISIPNSVNSIGDQAFSYCSSLTSVSIPNSVNSISVYAFYGCISLTSVSIPNSVTSIGDQAFCNCSSLTSVSIPNSVTSIGYCAFYNCEKLGEITVDDNNLKYCSINGVLYSKDKSILIRFPQGSKTSFFEIPNSVTATYWYAFEGCSNLTSVSIPNSVTDIGPYTFQRCSSLISMTIPDSVTYISPYVFNNCSGLTSVTIGNSVNSIDASFIGCENLLYIYCKQTSPPDYADGFSDEIYKNATLYVPVGTKIKYKNFHPWFNFWNIEEYDFSGVDVVTIEDYSDCPVEIYNLSGLKVGDSKENLSPGIYIMRQGNKVEKIMIQ